MVQFNHCPPGREKTTSATVLPQVDILQESVKISLVIAEVAELADALRSGRSEHYAREGSNPSFGTSKARVHTRVFFLSVFSD